MQISNYLSRKTSPVNANCELDLTSCTGGRHNTPRPLPPTLLTLKVVSESSVTWATFVTIIVFLGLSVLDLGPMYATGRLRQTDVRQTSDAHHRLMPPPYGA